MVLIGNLGGRLKTDGRYLEFPATERRIIPPSPASTPRFFTPPVPELVRSGRHFAEWHGTGSSAADSAHMKDKL